MPTGAREESLRNEARGNDLFVNRGSRANVGDSFQGFSCDAETQCRTPGCIMTVSGSMVYLLRISIFQPGHDFGISQICAACILIYGL